MSSPISQLLDTMGIEELCHKYYISLRQSLFMASLYFVIIGNIGLLILTCFLKQVSHSQYYIRILVLNFSKKFGNAFVPCESKMPCTLYLPIIIIIIIILEGFGIKLPLQLSINVVEAFKG